MVSCEYCEIFKNSFLIAHPEGCFCRWLFLKQNYIPILAKLANKIQAQTINGFDTCGKSNLNKTIPFSPSSDEQVIPYIAISKIKPWVKNSRALLVISNYFLDVCNFFLHLFIYIKETKLKLNDWLKMFSYLLRIDFDLFIWAKSLYLISLR